MPRKSPPRKPPNCQASAVQPFAHTCVQALPDKQSGLMAVRRARLRGYVLFNEHTYFT